MTIQQLKKQSDLEKRLKLLRQQLYGKGEFRVQSSEFRMKDKLITNYEPPTTNSSADITYLHQDLLKISVLAGLALGVQITLFFLMQHNLLKLSKLLLAQ